MLNASSLQYLRLETLDLSSAQQYLTFTFSIIIYLLTVTFNMLVFMTIVFTKKLHKPMFLLLLNLPISDTIGATAFFPNFLSVIATRSSLITYQACVTQAFMIHFYGTASSLILSAMAYDRYVAICSPLQYNTVMSPHSLIRLVVAVWLVSLLLIGTLFILLGRLTLCRRDIVDLYCNNPSLLKLACEDTSVNNYYGLFFIVILQGGPLLLITVTYAQILRTCVSSNSSSSRRKALQTCGSHLVVFLILEINTLVTLLAHRIGSASAVMRRFLGVSVVTFPPLLDPILYGLKITELKECIAMFLKKNFVKRKVRRNNG
ncbi:olfactory receptor 52B2-like [Synchiropus splendidus]|uniref:olfactory receptor 52B2-like n=1 Tax=Synchiropus splendidus TaxID=270530 RepID=UPI00237EB40D|nr:olfactory receptor 52B2-like [Synchiropus splendidus]